MFTGLIEEVGVVDSVVETGDGSELTFRANEVLTDVAVDDSISVDGCCLTVTSHTDSTFTVTAIPETLLKTTLGGFKSGQRINLERAVRVQDRLGGHLVQGHVDCTGVVTSIISRETGRELWIAFPEEFTRWVIPVGSITINGTSLTVATREPGRVKVALIPHTLINTNLGALTEGSNVNIEFDMVAKYIENFVVNASSQP